MTIAHSAAPRTEPRRPGAFAFLGLSVALCLLLALVVTLTGYVADALFAAPSEGASTQAVASEDGGFRPLAVGSFAGIVWWTILWCSLFGGLLLWPFAYFGLRDTRLARSAAIVVPTALVVAVVGTLLAGAVVFPMLALVLVMGISVCSSIDWTRKARNVGHSTG